MKYRILRPDKNATARYYVLAKRDGFSPGFPRFPPGGNRTKSRSCARACASREVQYVGREAGFCVPHTLSWQQSTMSNTLNAAIPGHTLYQYYTSAVTSTVFPPTGQCLVAVYKHRCRRVVGILDIAYKSCCVHVYRTV